MMKAWVENGTIRDVCAGNPSELYHPDVALHYTDDVPEEASNGDSWDGFELVKPAPFVPTPVETVVSYPELSPLEFKMCFTVTERLAIKAAKETDPILQDTYEILDDVRLKTVDLNLASNRNLIDYLVSLGCITLERAEQVKLGVQL